VEERGSRSHRTGSRLRREVSRWVWETGARRRALYARRGVKHAEVVTVGLVRDERGWLRLAG